VKVKSISYYSIILDYNCFTNQTLFSVGHEIKMWTWNKTDVAILQAADIKLLWNIEKQTR
jgi:hypothetical protein